MPATPEPFYEKGSSKNDEPKLYGHYPDGGRGMPPPPFPRYNHEHICIMCGKALTGRKQTFCGKECINRWAEEYSWAGMKRRVFERDDWTCVRCGYRPPLQSLKCVDGKYRLFIDGYNLIHCHHIKELEDGGSTTLDNLQTLCTKCHTFIHTTIGTNQRKHRLLDSFMEVSP
jgi:hypothetical protein